MKIIEENVNVTTFEALKSGDVFRDADTNKIFMKVSMSENIEITCDECDNTFEYYLDDYAVNLETGELNNFYLFDKVEKFNATLTISG